MTKDQPARRIGRREDALITELVSAFRYADPEAIVGLYGHRAQIDGTFDMRKVIGRFLDSAKPLL